MLLVWGSDGLETGVCEAAGAAETVGSAGDLVGVGAWIEKLMLGAGAAFGVRLDSRMPAIEAATTTAVATPAVVARCARRCTLWALLIAPAASAALKALAAGGVSRSRRRSSRSMLALRALALRGGSALCRLCRLAQPVAQFRQRAMGCHSDP